MELNEAIEYLKEWIRIDRLTRKGQEYSYYDNFCEEKCIAIDTLLTELGRLTQENKELKQKINDFVEEMRCME